MKTFEKPMVEIEEFEVRDVITTSTCPEEVVNCQYDLGL